ncbi:ABC transporter ATP-binding protein [Amycolatopsis sp. NPDC051371]|uniref:ABC transporter ATP-binding protein n=1 Tax=Amycolatopsis sp. NPDC051371 TaxID=3155800 RepID=UPI00342B64D1
MTAVANGLEYAVQMDSVAKTYGKGDAAVHALKGVSLGLRRGSFTAIMGPSGSGKSTFLHCAAGLDRPTSGRIMLGETELTGRRESELTALRRERIGFVFQSYNLLDALTVEQNIVLPLRLGNQRFDPVFLAEVVRSVELDVPLDRRPSKLSGGQQQRVAIARALVTRPEVVFLDEPTGALDTRTARQVLATLRQTVDRWGQTALMVTHDPVAASYADTVVFLADGRIAGELTGGTPERIAQRMTHLGEW